MTELLLDSPLDTDQRERAQVAYDSSQDLLALIKAVLEYASIEAGRVALDEAPLRMEAVFQAVIGALGPQAASKGLSIRADVSPRAGLWLRGDAGKLEQVLRRLLDNAIKFTERGQITIHADLVGEDADGVTLQVSVRDSGIGMPPAVQEQLFELFRQGDGSSTRRYAGIGLGLATCKRLVELRQGSIGVDSTTNQGTTVWFSARLPKRQVGCALTSARAALGL